MRSLWLGKEGSIDVLGLGRKSRKFCERFEAEWHRPVHNTKNKLFWTHFDHFQYFLSIFSVPRGREKAISSRATSFWNETSKATWRSEGHLSSCHQGRNFFSILKILKNFTMLYFSSEMCFFRFLGTWTATKWKA